MNFNQGSNFLCLTDMVSLKLELIVNSKEIIKITHSSLSLQKKLKINVNTYD